jgi:hypothetical protein
LKFKERLFGNIQFVGELNRRNLLSENILISVFVMLLAIGGAYEDFINDDTVEAATLLINKVGYLIDDKLLKLENTPVSERKSAAIERAKEYN